MAPAKKATPAKSLADRLAEEKEAPVVVDSPPEVSSEVTENPTVVDDTVIEDSNEYAQPLDKTIKPGEDHVHTWEENQDHNLGKVHPDVIPSLPPSEQAGVTRVVTDTVYAEPAEQDDKGFASDSEPSSDFVYDERGTLGSHDVDDSDEVNDPGYLEDENAKNNNEDPFLKGL